MRTTRYVLLFTFDLLFMAAPLIAFTQTAPLQFVALTTPCRLVDTRPQYGGSGPIQGGVPQSFVLTGKAGCNIPSSAQAFSLNVTVVPPGPLGFLIIWPTGEPQPGVSTLNSLDGRTKANAAIIGAGTNGAVSVYVSQTTNVLLDINGYFVSATDSALAFYPLTPCRLADTRPQYGGGGPIRGGTTQSFPILDIAGCTVPSTAIAYSLNIAAVPINALYYLTIWPKGDPLPNVSTLNDVPGTIVANAAIVVGGVGGEISAYPSNDTNLVIDIDGYFAPPAPGGLALYTVMPCRVIDTRRIGTGQPFSGTLVPPVDVAHSACAPPPQPQPLAYVLNGTVVPQGALGYLTLWPDGESLPNVSTLNALDGIIASNMAIVPTDQGPDYGKINAYAAGTTQLVLDISAYFAPLPTLSITTTSLPGGTINVPYSSTLAATGGEPPYSWTVTGGSLPPGLGLSSNGTISGTPIAGGMYNFTVQVTDTLANTASAMLSITIQTGSLVITTTQLPAGTVNVPYSASLGASGGTPPYMWSIISGTLPIGLSLNSGGMISGTPTVAGSSNFTVQVQDSSSPPVLATAPLSITINAGTTNAALQGNYALSFNGFNNGSPIFMAGSFIADGNGNITSGVLDIRDATGNTEQPVTLTGTYSIQANGLGAMTLTPSQGPALVFAVAISNRGLSGTSRNGNLILRDPSNPGSYGSGIILVQNSLNFKLSSLVGNYALGYFGVDASLKRIAGAAAYQMGQTGNLTNGAEDTNDNGVTSTATFTGTFSPVDVVTGRSTATLTTNGSVTHYALYVVSSFQIVMVSTDPSPANLTVWSISQQQVSSLGLNGVGVVEVTGVDLSGGSPVSEAEEGLLTTDGHGNGSISIDQNDGGTLNQLHGSGTYSVAGNGRVTLSSSFGTNPPVIYLVGRNQGFVVGTDSLVSSGILDAQSSPPFTNLSILGTYLGGTVTPALSSVTNAASWEFSDGNGNIRVSENTSGPSGPGSSQFSGTYQVDGTGRGTLTLNGSPAGIIYVASPQKFVLLPDGASPVLSTFALGSTN